MLNTKIQPRSFLGTGEEDFSVFLQYIGMAAILNKVSIPFNNMFQIKFEEIGPGLQRRSRSIMWTFDGRADGRTKTNGK